jgi:heat shock protein HslJ
LFRKDKAGSAPATKESIKPFADVDLRLARLVVDGQEVPLLAGKQVTARLLEGTKIAGQGPVNRFTGAYALGEKGAITLPPGGLTATRMAGTPEAMEAEQKLFNALGSASILETSPNGVTFGNQDGTIRVEFVKPPG